MGFYLRRNIGVLFDSLS